MAITKSSGVTPTERLLADLCDQTFLRLWSYPNLFKEDGKEFCDLIAVFEDHVFIFFDREKRQFDDTEKDVALSWQRWKRRVIDDQIRTAHGAERYLRSGRSLFIDKDLKVPFPIPVNRDRLVLHKIVVAHGASEACVNFSPDNVTGSLAISYGPAPGDMGMPFHVELDNSDPVHIFDTHNLSIVLSELDTVSDFANYMDEKVRAIKQYLLLTYCGEEDLLAHYFLNLDKKTKRHFIGVSDPDVNALMLGEGEWNSFVQGEPYKRKKQADEVSYFYDELIQKTCQNALDGKLMGNADIWAGPSAIKELVKEPRFMRRALAAKMIEAVGKFPPNPPPLYRSTNIMPSYEGGKAYVFLQLHIQDKGEYEQDYRPRKQAVLEIACGVARNKFPNLKKVVGIAIDAPATSAHNSEDFIFMDCSNWTDERQAHYEELNKAHNFFSPRFTKSYHRTVSEFPSAQKPTREPRLSKEKQHRVNRSFRRDRDALCSCGSGKPFRRCHEGRFST